MASHLGRSATDQLSGEMMYLADWTRQGSVYVGLLRIFREYSMVLAMTIKLYTHVYQRMAMPKRNGTTHMWNTLTAESAPWAQPAL
jgi:hypothetical protein